MTPPRIDGAEAQSQSVVTAPDTETAGLSFVKEVQHQTLMDHRYRSEGETVHSGGLKVSGSSTLDDLGFGKEKHPSTGGSTILLKHYGRLVSQWVSSSPFVTPTLLRLNNADAGVAIDTKLDVYDLGRTFGLLMPQLAMVSPSVLTMVLELSAASAGSVIGDRDRRNHIDLIQESPSLPPDQLPAFSALQMLISFVFSRARLFVESVPDTWGPMFTKSRSQPTFSIFSFTNTSHRRLWCNTVALLSRLGTF